MKSKTKSTSVYLRDYTPPPYIVTHTELVIALDYEETIVQSRLEVSRNPDLNDASSPLRLDGRCLELLELKLDGRRLNPGEYGLDSEGLTLRLPGNQATIETSVRISPADNLTLSGLYSSQNILCTQCEAEGFRRITFYPDRPDVRAPFRVRLEANRERFPCLLTNGNLLAKGDLEGGRHYCLYEDPVPKPSYLFAVVAGKLACRTRRIQAADGHEIALELYADPNRIERGDFALDALERAIRFDEEVFGRIYELDRYAIVAIDDFNMGAMENKGLNIFNSKYLLASPETASDDDYEHILAVVGHEYFHNWTGNRIGIRDWFQLSLKEGLTTWREQLFSARHGGTPVVRRIRDIRVLRARQYPEDAGPLAHPVRPTSYQAIDNFYTATVYEKGAELFRLAATLLGERTMRKALDLYFARHDGQAVTLEDFRRALEEASGRDLTKYQRWFEQAGTPHLRVRARHDPRRDILDLSISQHVANQGVSETQPVLIPIRLGLLDEEGQTLFFRDPYTQELTEETSLILEEAQARFRLADVSRRPFLSLCRGLSAPVVIEREPTDEELKILACHDPDGVNAWDALQELMLRTLMRMARGRTEALDVLLGTLRQVLSRANEPALLAEMLRLPEPSWISERLRPYDPARSERLRDRLRAVIGRRLRHSWIQLYETTRAQTPYRFEREEQARRSLNLVSLSYFAADGYGPGVAAARAHYEKADNLTDRLGALIAVNYYETKTRSDLLDDFFRRAQGEPALLDLWFGLEACGHGGDAVRRVHALRDHPAYLRTNPNRVHALIGSFTNGNLTAFHRSDGAGYRLLADELCILDSMNPLLASRLARSFGAPSRLPARRQQILREVLRELQRKRELSRELSEVVEQLLDNARPDKRRRAKRPSSLSAQSRGSRKSS